MRMDPGYEIEEMETNMESMFEHVNSMSNTDMPRDFLASLSKHFFRQDGEKYTVFQQFQTEACLVLENRRPHWRKRKAKSSSQFISMFYLLEKEVNESNDDIAKQLFVEIFNSRESYIESVMLEFDDTDKIEKQMLSGKTFNLPGYVDDEDLYEGREESSGTNASKVSINTFLILQCRSGITQIVKLSSNQYIDPM